MQIDKMKIVCFGGGSGLPSLLTGLKTNPWLKVTAIVNMFDNGGSSGELRDLFGILPPGDILRCLLAMSMDEDAARKFLRKRIKNDEHPGHTGGNLLLLGLEKVYGDYMSAVDALGQILSVSGSVMPVTVEQSTLCAKYSDGTIAKGEVQVDAGINKGLEIEKLFLEPVVNASVESLEAIKQADVTCIGPGSFYTSVWSNFLPYGIKEAIASSKSKIFFIANLFTEGAGMKDKSINDMVRDIEEAIGKRIDFIIVNNSIPTEEKLAEYKDEKKFPLLVRDEEADERMVMAGLWTDTEIARHDPAVLANLISLLAYKQT